MTSTEFHLRTTDIRTILELITGIVMISTTVIGGWIVGMRNRRRIKRALGTDATDTELVSLNTWLNVAKSEEPNRGMFDDHLNPRR